MPENFSRILVRILVPLVLLVGGGLIAWQAMSHPKLPGTTETAPSTPAAATPVADAQKAEVPPAAQSKEAPAQPADAVPSMAAAPGSDQASKAPSDGAKPGSQPPAPGTPLGTLKVREVPAATLTSIGSLTPKDKGGTYELELAFSPIGAGVDTLALANHFTSIQKIDHEVIQKFQPVPGQDRLGLVAFAADAIEVNQQRLSLWASPSEQTSLWRQSAPGMFEAIIENDAGAPVLEITREYQLKPGSFEFQIRQSVKNLSGSPVSVRFIQFGPKELPLAQTRYGGDVRRARFGYTLPTNLDPAQIVQSGDSRSTLITHSTLLGSATGSLPGSGLATWTPKTVWPTDESIKRQLSLVWAATTSRYFAVAAHAPESAGSKHLAAAESIERVAIASAPSAVSRGPDGIAALRLISSKTELAPGASADFSISAYGGPLSKPYISAEKGAFWAGLDRVVIFTFGGPCGFCTFQPVAEFLRWFLGLLHDFVFHDWALAIMFLVVCVRTLLHPVTRWSQTNMLRFGKHMSRLGPKQKAIQEKYANDQAKMREEIARLMREEHVSYASGALGCVPMIFQMPVWVALYAMLFFTFELRHEHAFYGIVQSLTQHKWAFLGDLAEPDHFIGFGKSISIPLLSGLMGPIESLNILPLVMGVVFFIQQKYLQPPQTTQLTPEMEQQQKIMKVMTVVMFPLFMYNAPCGLALYFLTNSTLSILESKWIRAKAEKIIEAEDAARAARVAAGGGTSMWDRKKKAQGEQPTGFFARLQKMAEDAQKLQDQKRKAAEKKR